MSGLLSIHDVADYLASVTYKPNIEFDVLHTGALARYGASEVMVVYLIAYAMDSNATYPPAHEMANMGIAPETVMALGGQVRIGGHIVNLTPRRIKLGVQVPDVALMGGIEHFQEWFKRELICKWELHEVDEWFRVDGKQVTDPHPELAAARRGIDGV